MKIIRKYLVIGVIFLFIGASVLPSINGTKNAINAKDSKELLIQEKNQIKEERPSTSFDVDWWPMFHHDLQHTGYSTSDAPDENLELWTKSTNWAISTSPAVVDDYIYIGSSNKYMYCFDAVTSKKIWDYEIISNFLVSPTSPAVAYDRVYFGGADGFIYCLNAINGYEEWKYTNATPVPCSIFSDPTVVNDRVYIGTGSCYYQDHDVLCLDAYTGEQLWKFDADEKVFNSPAVFDDKVYIGNDKLYCLDALNGELINNTAEKYFAGSPTIAEDRIYIGSYDHNLYCLDAETLDEKWFFTTGDEVQSTPAVAYGNIYFGSNDKKVYCLDTDGNIVWSKETGDTVVSSPAVADGKVYVGSSDNYFYCLDAYNGDIIWKDETGGSVVSSPAIANGLVYVGSGDGKVYAYRGGIFYIEMIKPKERWLYIRDIELFEFRRIVSALVFGPVSVTVYAIDTEYGIENVTFYFNDEEIYNTNISDDNNNFIWNWPAWKFPYRPFVLFGYLKVRAENGLGQILQTDSVQMFRIGGWGGYPID